MVILVPHRNAPTLPLLTRLAVQVGEAPTLFNRHSDYVLYDICRSLCSPTLSVIYETTRDETVVDMRFTPIHERRMIMNDNIGAGLDEKICGGCRKIKETKCSVYGAMPSAYARAKRCPFNFRPDVAIERTRVGQQKQKKGV